MSSWQTAFNGINFIYNHSNSTPGKPVGLNVKWASTNAGQSIIIYPWGGGASNELWTIDNAGHMFPANCGGSMVAGFGAPLNGQEGYNIVLVNYNKNDTSQNWYDGGRQG
jgi:hypothetical protein